MYRNYKDSLEKEIDRRLLSSCLLFRTLSIAEDFDWQLGYIRRDILDDLCVSHRNGDYEKVISGCEDFDEDFQQMREAYDEMSRDGSL